MDKIKKIVWEGLLLSETTAEKEVILKGMLARLTTHIRKNYKIRKGTMDGFGDIWWDELEMPEGSIERLRVYVGEIELNYPKLFEMAYPLLFEQLLKLLKSHKIDDVLDVFSAMQNSTTLLKKYESAYLTANNWLRRR